MRRLFAFIGYGNPDRQDDGVAWHILQALSLRVKCNITEIVEDICTEDPSPHLLFVPQITPDLAETCSKFDRVCFIDAHTGQLTEEIHWEDIKPSYELSAFTHHMTPALCLELSRTIYGKIPRASLLSVRGYEFGFSRTLSNKTQLLAEQALEVLLRLVDEENVDE